MLTWDLTKIVLLVGLLVFTGLLWWLPNKLVAPAGGLVGAKHPVPDYYIDNFTVTAMNDAGLPKHTLQAKTLIHFPGNEKTQLDRPRLVQYPQNGSNGPPVVTVSDTGWLSGDGKLLVMSGRVEVARGGGAGFAGAEINTQQLTVSLE